MTLAEWNERLAATFSLVRDQRPDGRPVFALEHGLSPGEIEQLNVAVRTRVRTEPPTSAHQLAFVVYSAELGYRFDGLEFWQSFADATPGWTAFWTETRRRRWVREAFRRFAAEYRGAVPSGAWAQSHGYIAWPITHAILPLDFQRHIVQVLGLRLKLRAIDLSDTVRLGEQIQAEAGRTSNRFQDFTQQTALVGQIALAILEEDDQAAAYLDPKAVRRFVGDIQRRRADKDLLAAARQKARVHLRGLRERSTSQPKAGHRNVEDPSPRSLGLAVDLDVRPRQDGSWTVGLTLPSLYPLAAYHPSFRSPLETSPLSVNGADRDLPAGTLLYGRQRVVLDRWPNPARPLLKLDSGDARLNGIVRELGMSTTGMRLFRVQSDGTTRETKSRTVRAGETYVLLNPSGPPPPGAMALNLLCEGVSGVQISVPDDPDEAFIGALRACGAHMGTGITVWPAGPPPALWDGAGTVEWLESDVPAVGLSADAPILECELSLDGGPALSLGSLAAGEQAFVSLGHLDVGVHRVALKALVDDGGGGLVSEGTLAVRVRERSRWSPGDPAAAPFPLHVRVTPPSPDLDEFWDGGVAVEVFGPPGLPVRLQVDFHETPDGPSFATRPLSSLSLPISSSNWRAHVSQHLLGDAKAGSFAERASLVRVRLDARSLGTVSVDITRRDRPLRWLVDGQRVRLLDDRGEDEEPAVIHVTPEQPIGSTPLSAIEAMAGMTLLGGGLVVAGVGSEEVSALVLPHVAKGDGFAALQVLTPDCSFGDVRRTAGDLRRLLESARRWGGARYANASLAAANLRRHVLHHVAQAIACQVCGKNWVAAEVLAEDGLRVHLDMLALQVPPRDVLPHWRRHLPGASALVDATPASRVEALVGMATTLDWLLPLHHSTDPVRDAILRSTLGPKHAGWAAEFALRLASAPHTVTAWADGHLDGALDLVLDAPQLLRAARYLVLASSAQAAVAPTGLALYSTWTWPSLA